MKNYSFLLILIALLQVTFVACDDDNDFPAAAPIVPAVTNLTHQLSGDTVGLSWSLPAGFDTLYVTLKTPTGEVMLANNATSYKYGVVETNKEYFFSVKLRDTKGNLSLGQSVKFTREGAQPVKNLTAVQNNTDVVLSWEVPTGISGIKLSYGTTTVDLAPTTTTYTIQNMAIGRYRFNVVTTNSQNKLSNSVLLDFKVGSTIVAYVGVYADKAALLANGDDDEIAAANWLFNTFPTSVYISFDQIKNAQVNLADYRVIWWNRDVESGGALPAAATDPVVVERIGNFYKEGGGLLLSTYAIQYLWKLGRMTEAHKMGIDVGGGFSNPDTWGVGVRIKGQDQRQHPLFKGIEITTPNGGFPVIGPGWKENHNCVLIEVPAFYGLGNGDDLAYSKFTTNNNLKWLGVWDGIGDYFMCGVFELMPNPQFAGSSINIGIGGIEWNQNSQVNPHQSNIETMYKNAIDYLKTK